MESQVAGRWDDAEHQHFLEALMQHGKKWQLIQDAVVTRVASQVRSHAQKFFLNVRKLHKMARQSVYKHKPVSEETLALKKILLDIGVTDHTPHELLVFLGLKASSQQDFEPSEVHEHAAAIEEEASQIAQLCEGENEDSFFAQFMRANHEHFAKGKNFEELIDLPEDHYPQAEEQPPEDTVSTGRRKMSFTAYDDLQQK